MTHHLAVDSGISLPTDVDVAINVGRENWNQSSIHDSGHLWVAERPKKVILGRTHLVSAVETDVSRYETKEAELRLDDGRFQRYLRLTVAMFDDLLARVGARILPSGHQLQALHISGGAHVHLSPIPG
ncbi:unnamed protein product [Boreogadus saida]